MHILFLTDNFPPEGNAPASRTYEHAREWLKDGHKITVITCVPNFPEGKIFEGYKNKWLSKEQVDDYGLLIDKHRKTFDSLENKIQEQQKELYKGLRDGASGKVALDSLSLFLGKIEKANLLYLN